MNFSMNIINKNNRLKLFCLAVVAMLAVVGSVAVIADADHSDAAGTYTVAFNANGGSGSISSITCSQGSAITMPSCTFTAPTGYSFLGWMGGSSGSASTSYLKTAGTSYTPTVSGTFSAIWSTITDSSSAYITTFASDSATVGTTYTKVITYDKTLAGSDIGDAYVQYPSWAHVSAFSDGSATVTGTPSTIGTYRITVVVPADNNSGVRLEIQYDLVVRAVATPSTYTVSYNSNGGSGSMSSQSATEVTYTTLKSCTFTAPVGYSFSGWCVGNSGTVYAAGASYMVTASVTMYAQWTASYVVSFNANGGSGTVESIACSPGSSMTLPSCTFTAPTGYSFKGWAIGSSGSTSTGTLKATGATYTPTASITFSAIWSAFTDSSSAYITTFASDSATVGVTYTKTITYSTSLAGSDIGNAYVQYPSWMSVSAYSDGSATVTGTPSDSGTYRITVVIPADNNSGVRLEIQYDLVVGKVLRFDTNGGSVTATVPIPSNGIVTQPADPTKDGCAFGGWFTDINCTTGNEVDFATAFTDSATIYAKWTRNTAPAASFIYSINGLEVTFTDTSVAADSWTYSFGDTSTSTQQNPMHPYSAIGSYDVTLSISNNYNGTSTDTYSLTITLTQTLSVYTVTFDSNGGSTVASVQTGSGLTISAPSSPTLPGCTFCGWYDLSVSGSETFDFSTPITANKTLTAGWVEGETPAPVTDNVLLYILAVFVVIGVLCCVLDLSFGLGPIIFIAGLFDLIACALIYFLVF